MSDFPQTFNKVIVRTSGNNLNVIDLSEDTVTPNNLLSGITAHDNSGDTIVGKVDVEGGTGAGGNFYEGILGIDGDTIEEIFEAKNIRGYLQGDIFIIKEQIDDNKYSYTAYYFYDEKWNAMDGNYNAENVYFDENITITTAVGNILLENGSGTIPSKGKNLKQVFESIWTSESNPTIVQPSVLITTSHQYKEVGSSVIPAYTLSLSPGSYLYGPETNVVATDWEASFDGQIKNTQNGSFSSLIIKEGACCQVTAKATYTSGTIPVTNLGNDYINGQIKSGTATTSKNLFTGYRPNFYGFKTSPTKINEVDSNFIRNLSVNQKQTTSPVSEAKVTSSWIQFFYALPKGRKNSLKIKDSNNLPLTAETFEITLNHEGSDSSIYTVFYIDLAAEYSATTLYFTWG